MLGSEIPRWACTGELPYREDGISVNLGTSPAGFGVPSSGVLGPLLFLHQATKCLFQAHWVCWFICPCVPSARCTAQHMAGGSVEWSWLTRPPRVGRLETRGRRGGVKEVELRHEPCLRRRPRPSELRRHLPRKLATPKVDLPPVQDWTTGTPSAGSRAKSPEERRGAKEAASPGLWKQTAGTPLSAHS